MADKSGEVDIFRTSIGAKFADNFVLASDSGGSRRDIQPWVQVSQWSLHWLLRLFRRGHARRIRFVRRCVQMHSFPFRAHAFENESHSSGSGVRLPVESLCLRPKATDDGAITAKHGDVPVFDIEFHILTLRE